MTRADDKLRTILDTLAALGDTEALALGTTVRPPALSGAALLPADEGATIAVLGAAPSLEEARSLPHLTLAPWDAVRGQGTTELAIKALLGEGGMGRVELAWQRSLGREVALKSVRPDREGDAAVLGLLTEAQVTGRLEHPNIIPVHALGRDDAGRPLMIMKRVEGVVWSDLLRDPEHPAWRGERDRAARHLEVLVQVCNAVHFAHDRGIVHRDLKPDNVMVGGFGEVYVLDWGIAVRSGVPALAGGLAGTPLYLAPEMLAAEGAVTARTDVFLLGAILHEVLVGKPRHAGSTIRAVLAAAMAVEPVDYGASVPEELAAIANRATSRDPGARHESALAFREAIAGYLRHKGSLDLADEAARRHDELCGLLDVGGAEPQRVRRLAAECQFGFRHALRVWEANARARAGLEASLVRMVEYEVAQANRGAAEGFLAELPDPSPTLVERVSGLTRRLREQEAAQEQLSRMERDLDVRVSERHRIAILGLLGLLSVGIVVSGLSRGPSSEPSLRDALRLDAVAAAVVVTSLLAFRRAFLANRFNRQVGALLLSAIAIPALHHLLLLPFGTRAPEAVTGDLLVLAGICTAGAIGVHRPLAWTSATYVCAAFLVSRQPAHATDIYALAGITATIVVVWSWRRSGKTQPAGAPRAPS